MLSSAVILPIKAVPTLRLVFSQSTMIQTSLVKQHNKISYPWCRDDHYVTLVNNNTSFPSNGKLQTLLKYS